MVAERAEVTVERRGIVAGRAGVAMESRGIVAEGAEGAVDGEAADVFAARR